MVGDLGAGDVGAHDQDVTPTVAIGIAVCAAVQQLAGERVETRPVRLHRLAVVTGGDHDEIRHPRATVGLDAPAGARAHDSGGLHTELDIEAMVGGEVLQVANPVVAGRELAVVAWSVWQARHRRHPRGRIQPQPVVTGPPACPTPSARSSTVTSAPERFSVAAAASPAAPAPQTVTLTVGHLRACPIVAYPSWYKRARRGVTLRRVVKGVTTYLTGEPVREEPSERACAAR